MINYDIMIFYVNILKKYKYKDCDNCPINWGEGNCLDDGNDGYGLFRKVSHLIPDHKYKEAAIIANQIANLPEKKVSEEDEIKS